jgi:hypothetical protein
MRFESFCRPSILVDLHISSKSSAPTGPPKQPHGQDFGPFLAHCRKRNVGGATMLLLFTPQMPVWKNEICPVRSPAGGVHFTDEIPKKGNRAGRGSCVLNAGQRWTLAH